MKYCKDGFYTCHGDPVKIILSPVIDEYGRMDFRENGKVNTDEEIQSYAESCDLNLIIQRFQNGDIDVLSRNKPMYGDFTNLPKTYAEFLQKKIDAEKAFYKLPTEVRDKFDNDLNQFLAVAGSEDWFEKLGFKKEDKEVKEVVEE